MNGLASWLYEPRGLVPNQDVGTKDMFQSKINAMIMTPSFLLGMAVVVVLAASNMPSWLLSLGFQVLTIIVAFKIGFQQAQASKSQPEAFSAAPATVPEQSARISDAESQQLRHDIRACIATLTWSLSSISRKEMTASELETKTNRMNRAIVKLTALVDELVDGKEETRLAEKTEEDSDLSKVIDQSVTMLLPLAHAKNITVEVQMSTVRANVRARVIDLSRIVDNLVRNAIVHNPSGTHIVVSLKVNGNQCVLTVKDNGKGCQSEKLDAIFKAAGAISGGGLGLRIVKELADKMGALSTATSQPNRGTVFTVIWTQPQEILQKSSQQEPQSPSGKTLIVGLLGKTIDALAARNQDSNRSFAHVHANDRGYHSVL